MAIGSFLPSPSLPSGVQKGAVELTDKRKGNNCLHSSLCHSGGRVRRRRRLSVSRCDTSGKPRSCAGGRGKSMPCGHEPTRWRAELSTSLRRRATATSRGSSGPFQKTPSASPLRGLDQILVEAPHHFVGLIFELEFRIVATCLVFQQKTAQ